MHEVIHKRNSLDIQSVFTQNLVYVSESLRLTVSYEKRLRVTKYCHTGTGCLHGKGLPCVTSFVVYTKLLLTISHCTVFCYKTL